MIIFVFVLPGDSVLREVGAVVKPCLRMHRRQMKLFAGQRRPFGIDVALPVGHHRDGGGRGQHRLGRGGRVDPTARFLVFERPLAVRGLDPALARVDRACHQAQAAAVAGVHRHHRMHQHAAAYTLTDLTQTAPPLGRRVEVELARILNRQHVPAGHSRPGLFAPALDQALDRHLLVGQKTPETNFSRTAALAQPAQAYALARHHAFEQHRPPLSRRRSRNRPNDIFSSDMATPRRDSKCCPRNHIPDPTNQPKSRPESLCRTKMCACRSASTGGDPIQKGCSLQDNLVTHQYCSA